MLQPALEIARAQRYGLWLAVIMCDIDHFKSVNDNYGHSMGDFILKNFGDMIKLMTRENIDSVFRYGGEEFMILLPQTDLKSAKLLAERLRASLESHVFKIKDLEIGITASFGIASINYAVEGKATSQDEFFAFSDEMLYLAKTAGRNCIKEMEI
jgi:diguanylate cyclase